MKLLSVITLTALLAAGFVSAQEAPPPDQPGRPRRADGPKLNEMSADQKAKLESELNDVWSKLPLEGKVRIMRLHRALREMPKEDRQFMHDRVERFLNMPPEERDRLRQNREKWQQMSPEEREKAREEFRKRREEMEKKWRAEHPGEEPPPFGPRGDRPPPPPAE